MKPRVIHFIESLEVGGAEKLVCDFATARGADSTSIACLRAIGPFGEELRATGFPVDLIGWQGLRWRTMLRIRRYLLEKRPDILHCHHMTAHLFGAPAARLAGVPVVLTRHGPQSPGTGPAAWFNQLMMQRTQVVGVSEGTRVRMQAWIGPRARPVVMIPNGISLAPYRAMPSKADARHARGWPASKFIVGIVARLIPGKGHALLMDTIAKMPDALLVVAGDGPLRAELEARKSANVMMLGEQSDIPGVLAGLDVFCLPSDEEGLPVTLLEAMAARLPVVVTSVGAIPTVVEDGTSGILIAPRDGAGLSRALVSLMNDEALRESMGRAALARVDPAFSVQAALDAYEDVYAKMLATT